jgi:hypothetical protein
MGFTTRVDVPLRAFVPQSRAQSRGTHYETYTDLDVLGVAITPGFAVRRVISDCKTTQRGSTERMFWVRGVSDFFAADEAWMVRTGGVTAASRQLAARLRISVLEPNDLAKLEEFYPSDLGLEGAPLAVLFDESRVATAMKVFTTLDKKLETLVEYRQLNYWVYEEYRNLQQVVAHLVKVSKHLDPSQPPHRALFVDCAWLYTLSLAHAARYVRAVHVSDIDTALQQYLFGGQMGLQEKQRVAGMLARHAPVGVAMNDGDGVLPSWYPALLELLTRHLRRPTVVGDELRYAEWAAEAQLAKESANVAEAFGGSFNPIAAKLLADVCGFLVTVGGLRPEFRGFARTVFAQPDTTSPPPPDTVREGLYPPDISRMP